MRLALARAAAAFVRAARPATRAARLCFETGDLENETMSARRPSMLRAFLANEAAGGVILMGAAVLALVIANSPAAPAYFGALRSYLGPLTVIYWINDALMAVFFLLVGLEIKRELLDGQLSTWPRRLLPGVAAAGGMAIPALVYVAVNQGYPAGLRGWAIPAATDIAFALGILALIGSRAPASLKVFLTAIAILDDLGAVLIIAVFYTANLSLPALAGSAAVFGLLVALNRAGLERLAPYLVLGVVLWVLVFLSGVHATIAGVLLALTIPLRRSPGRPEDAESPLHKLEHAIQPWSAFAIVPIFGFANAGVSLAGLSWSALLQPITLGIALGLFAGKQIGVFGTTWLAVRLRLADLPEHASWTQLYGVALLCGVGFTMSLFIGLLAFPADQRLQDAVKIGVLAGSFASAALGSIVLMLSPRTAKAPRASARQTAP
jgi:NhaA family Na+:H+ antiporter